MSTKPSPDMLNVSLQQVAEQNALNVFESFDDMEQADPEILADLGILSADEAGKLTQTATIERAADPRRVQAASAIGAHFCASCAESVPDGKTCFGGHLTVSRTGKGRTNGY